MASTNIAAPYPMMQATPHLILTNISKRANIRSLLLAAASFGCGTVFVVKQKSFNFDFHDLDNTDLPGQLLSHLRKGKILIERFDRLEECVDRVHSMGIRIVGVEIDEAANDVEAEPFLGDTAFMMGNEGQGMNERQMASCDGFVRIAQHGSGTASLNVSVAAGIVLHRFHHWSRGEAMGCG